jgi:serine/threonine-protein kinase
MGKDDRTGGVRGPDPDDGTARYADPRPERPEADPDRTRTGSEADLDRTRTSSEADLDRTRTSSEADLDRTRTSSEADLDRTRTSSEAAEPSGARRERVSRLGALASFSELSNRLLRRLGSRMVERRYEAGAPLMRQGDRGDCLLVIQHGEVEVAVAHDGERHVLKRAGAGEVFGEMALLTHEPRTADVVALTPVRALVLSVEDFDALLPRYPELAEVLSRLTARRLGRETHDALSGKQFHGYAIRRRLGRGGMAVVYEAVETATGRRVALKMMSHRLVFHEVARERFQQEADLIESFEHPNIARMYGRFEAFRTYFMIIEHCDGVSLDHILARRPRLDASLVRPIVGQLAGALQYAHGRRIVHRDIKPSNVMIDRQGVVKLMDFGLARVLPEASESTYGAIAGSPPYMAPEQLTEGPIGTWTDRYGLAGLAWRMLAGSSLFRPTDFDELREAHEAWQVPSVDDALPDLAADLRSFLEACLVRDPARREADLGSIARWAAPVPFDAIATD